MADEFEVLPSILEDDAEKWQGWHDDIVAIKDAIPDVPAAGFSFITGADAVREAYGVAVAGLRSGLDAGAAEFQGIADKLRWAAGQYTSTEADVAASFQAIEVE